MVGDIIVGAHGKLENKRILSVEGGVPQIEVTVSQSGKIHWIDVSKLVTYLSIPNGDGTIYAEGEGVIMIKGDDEAITWIGKISGQTRKDVGSALFNTSSNNGRLSFLNNTVGVFEFFAEGDGTVKGTIWEWK